MRVSKFCENDIVLEGPTGTSPIQQWVPCLFDLRLLVRGNTRLSVYVGLWCNGEGLVHCGSDPPPEVEIRGDCGSLGCRKVIPSGPILRDSPVTDWALSPLDTVVVAEFVCGFAGVISLDLIVVIEYESLCADLVLLPDASEADRLNR